MIRDSCGCGSSQERNLLHPNLFSFWCEKLHGQSRGRLKNRAHPGAPAAHRAGDTARVEHFPERCWKTAPPSSHLKPYFPPNSDTSTLISFVCFVCLFYLFFFNVVFTRTMQNVFRLLITKQNQSKTFTSCSSFEQIYL